METSNLKKLKKQWYKKLKSEGFSDIEAADGQLKTWTSTLIGNHKKVFTQNGGWQAKQEYYRLAAHFLYENKFRSNYEKILWEYHANGVSYRSIAKLLKSAKVRNTNRTSVMIIIKRLRKKMLKMYMEK